jgi:hypothetical protein
LVSESRGFVAAADEFKFYGGIDGGLKLNTYGNLLRKPF